MTDIRKGFVYKRVPHITLKSIANNEEIDTIYDQHQQKMEPIRNEINNTLGVSLQEWEIPREPEQDWPSEVAEKLKKW